MGLDMYLTAKWRTYKSDEKEDMDNKEDKRVSIKRIFPEIFDSGNIQFIGVEFEAGYWRKANAIHRWFVDNVQDGEDDCGSYDVCRDELIKLKKLCEDVINKKAEPDKTLPTQEGFFFGEVEYDSGYLDDLNDTIKIIDRCLKLPEEWSFEYSSSW